MEFVFILLICWQYTCFSAGLNNVNVALLV